MAWLLDTNACIDFLNGHPGVIASMRARAPGDIRLCSIVVAELAFGAYNSRRPAANLVRHRQFVSVFPSLPFDDRAADDYGQIRAELHMRGKPVGANDLLIAAIARVNDLVLVTNDTAEFRRVPGLSIEDWRN